MKKISMLFIIPAALIVILFCSSIMALYGGNSSVVYNYETEVLGKYISPSELNDDVSLEKEITTKEFKTYSKNLLRGSNLPSKYDSRDVDGVSYVTSLKSQFNELCWNYALTSVIESKLLKSGLENDSSSLDLAERMMDYATTDPTTAVDIGINPYYGDYVLHSLADAGNGERYASALINGLFPIDESKWNYDTEYMGKVKPEDIYSFNNIKYQVNETMYLSDNNYTLGFDEEFNRKLKQYVIENGSVEISIRVGAGKNYVDYYPAGNEELLNHYMLNRLYYKDVSATYTSNDHAVAIIGYDDDYVHNVCILAGGELENAKYNSNTDSYSCNTGTLKEIRGAWIIKNSNYSYDYVAYETTNSDYEVINDISLRDWDNVYSITNKNIYTRNGQTYTFKKKDNEEKVVSIKFSSTAPISDLKVYINPMDGTGEKLLTEFTSEYGGIHTIKISDNIILSSDEFRIRMSDYSFPTFSIFTSNNDSISELDIEDAETVNSFSYQSVLDDYENVIVLNGTSRNINNNINFVIKNSNNEDVTSMFNIIRNYPVGNYVNTLIRFNDNVPLGEYAGYAYVNDTLLDTFKIDIKFYLESMIGEGTEDNPYIITNPKQLDMIRQNKYAYYKLGNDIDLTYDTQNENGLFYNDGKGWEPISFGPCNQYINGYFCSDGFTGSIDGDNYTIKGLYINRPTENAVGLFRSTYNDNFSGLNFRNIKFKDANVRGNNYVGILLGNAYGATYERTLIVENIITEGSVTGNNYVGGIIGYFWGGTGLPNYLVDNTSCSKRHCLNSLFNFAHVIGNNYVGGIVGLLATQNYYNSSNSNWRSTIDVYNWQNIGLIESNGSASGFIGYALTNNGNTITLNNSINTGTIKGNKQYGIVYQVESILEDSSTYTDGKVVLNNIYYVNDNGYDLENNLILANNVKKYSILELTNDDIYSSFSNFNDYYKKETIDGIKRIPFLKNVSVNYTSVSDIDSDVESVNIYDYVQGIKDLNYVIADPSIAAIDEDGNITLLKRGTTTISVTSNYDGYYKDISLVSRYPLLEVNLYDLNQNDKFDLQDIIILLKIYLGSEEEIYVSDMLLGDMDEDGQIRLNDIITLLRMYLSTD